MPKNIRALFAPQKIQIKNQGTRKFWCLGFFSPPRTHERRTQARGAPPIIQNPDFVREA